MTHITVSFPDSKSIPITFPDDLPIGKLIEYLAKSTGVALDSQAGQGVRYHLTVKQKDDHVITLEDTSTLADQKVQEGDILQFVINKQSHLKIGVINPEETEKVMLEVPSDVVVGQLTDSIARTFQVPQKLLEGQTAEYYLDTRNKDGSLSRLDNLKTLMENNIHDGNILQLSTDFKEQFASDKEFSKSVNTYPSVVSEKITRDPHQQNLIERNRELEQLVAQQAQQLKKLNEDITNYKSQLSLTLQFDHLGKPSVYSEKLSVIEFINFDLIFSKEASEYIVIGQWFNGEQQICTQEKVKIPLSLDDLELYYLRSMNLILRSKGDTLNTAAHLGEILFEAIFVDSIKQMFQDCLNFSATNHGCVVQLRLNFEEAIELYNYPWEFLWREPTEFLLNTKANQLLTIIRYFHKKSSLQPQQIESTLQVLFVTASPLNYESFVPEKQMILEALQYLHDHQALQITILENATKQSLEQRLKNESNFHVVHFMGHSIEKSGQVELVLEDEEGEADLLDSKDFLSILNRCRKLKLVTLNTCRGARAFANDPFASVAVTSLKSHIPAVIAMQHEIHPRAAINFYFVLYRNLAAYNSIYKAMLKARASLYDFYETEIEWAIPVLYSYSADGILFKPK